MTRCLGCGYARSREVNSMQTRIGPVGCPRNWLVQQMETNYHPGQYFRTADEANDWLAFDEVGSICDDAEFAAPDQYEEWRQWREAANGNLAGNPLALAAIRKVESSS